jgi:DNA-binding NarL/FixJ family response regulator
MAKNIKTHIFCYDDHRGFSEDVRKKFNDTTRYTVLSFQTREEFINRIEHEKEYSYCKVAILGLHDTIEQFEMIDHLTIEVKKTDPSTGLILVGPPDKMDMIRKTVKFNIDAYIPKNSNAILRIHNAVKKLISENGITIFRKRSNLSVYFLAGFFILALISLIVAWFRFPQYF